MARLTRPTILVLVSIVVSALFAQPALASPGDLDAAFGGDGIVTTAVNASSDARAGIALTAGGGVLAAGSEENAGHTSSEFVVVEYTQAGHLDQHFGGVDGIATARFQGCAGANGMVVDSQGRIVVVGVRHDPCNSQESRIVVARFLPDGTLDSSFGGGSGKEIFSLAGTGEGATAVAMDGNKIVVAGAVRPKHASMSDFVLLRIDSDGHLDHAFSNDGFAFVKFAGASSVPLALAVQPDHRAVACGGSAGSQGDERFVVARLLASGGLDTSFSSDGKATVGFGSGGDECVSVLLDSVGIVLGGSDSAQAGGDCALVRLTTAGHIDTSFGTNGRVTQSLSGGLDGVTGLALGGSGKIVVSAVKDAAGNARFAVLRYRDDGSLDSSFGTGGIVSTKINNLAVPGPISVGGGSIVVSGATVVQSTARIAVAKYLG